MRLEYYWRLIRVFKKKVNIQNCSKKMHFYVNFLLEASMKSVNVQNKVFLEDERNKCENRKEKFT